MTEFKIKQKWAKPWVISDWRTLNLLFMSEYFKEVFSFCWVQKSHNNLTFKVLLYILLIMNAAWAVSAASYGKWLYDKVNKARTLYDFRPSVYTLRIRLHRNNCYKVCLHLFCSHVFRLLRTTLRHRRNQPANWPVYCQPSVFFIYNSLCLGKLCFVWTVVTWPLAL